MSLWGSKGICSICSALLSVLENPSLLPLVQCYQRYYNHMVPLHLHWLLTHADSLLPGINHIMTSWHHVLHSLIASCMGLIEPIGLGWSRADRERQERDAQRHFGVCRDRAIWAPVSEAQPMPWQCHPVWSTMTSATARMAVMSQVRMHAPGRAKRSSTVWAPS